MPARQKRHRDMGVNTIITGFSDGLGLHNGLL